MSEPLERNDRLARQRALDPTTSFIVQAPAGSGKTELLIQRFLTLLARVQAPEEVVAITFTRKAAAEMRKRVLDALAAASAGKPAQSEQERITLALAEHALHADEAHAWGLIDNPARLRILTIDALCLSHRRADAVVVAHGRGAGSGGRRYGYLSRGRARDAGAARACAVGRPGGGAAVASG